MKRLALVAVLLLAVAASPAMAHDSAKALALQRAGVIHIGDTELSKRQISAVAAQVIPAGACPSPFTRTLPVPRLCNAGAGWDHESGVRICRQDFEVTQVMRLALDRETGTVEVFCVETGNSATGEPYDCGECSALIERPEIDDPPIFWDGPLPDPWGDPER